MDAAVQTTRRQGLPVPPPPPPAKPPRTPAGECCWHNARAVALARQQRGSSTKFTIHSYLHGWLDEVGLVVDEVGSSRP